MEMLEFFDCNCQFGMRGIVYPGSFYKPQDLLKKMGLYGIKKALVHHSMAREYNPVVGNKMLLDEIKNYPELVPVWVVMPHHTGEFPEADELVKQMQQHGVKAVRMYPSIEEQNYSVAKWNCGEIFSTLEKYRVPLLIGLDELNWNDIYEMCTNHPDLRLILTGVNYRIDRNLYPLLENFNNLYIETIGYKTHNGIEEICGEFGSRRLVFGSGMPIYSGGSAVSMINYARISEKEKRMIAFENLNMLLGGALL